MSRLTRFLLSRKLAASLIAALLLSLAVWQLLSPAGPASGMRLPSWPAPLWAALGVRDAYPPLGAALLAVLGLVMAYATVARARVAWARTFRPARPREPQSRPLSAEERELLDRRLASGGWVRMRADARHPSDERYVRFPWGYWSGVLLHAGMVVVLLGSLAVMLSGQRGTATLHPGEPLPPGATWDSSQAGPLAPPLERPGELTLERLDVTYRPTGELDVLRSTLGWREGASAGRLVTGVNDVGRWRGIRVYQSQEFGPSFVVAISGGGAPAEPLRIDLLDPPKLGGVSYRDLSFPWMAQTLQVKGYVDALGRRPVAGKAMALRLLASDGSVVGPLELSVGEKGSLGPYEVTLSGIGTWDRLVFVRDRGMSAVFAGFFIICVSAALIYAMPPREVYLATDDPGPRVWRRAGRFDADLDDGSTLSRGERGTAA